MEETSTSTNSAWVLLQEARSSNNPESVKFFEQLYNERLKEMERVFRASCSAVSCPVTESRAESCEGNENISKRPALSEVVSFPKHCSSNWRWFPNTLFTDTLCERERNAKMKTD